MRTARVVAQCKINLFLRVLAREASGYHQLETLFCRLALGDVVTVRLGGSTRTLDCSGPSMPAEGLGPVERNLAWRAADAFIAAAGLRTGFAIEIEKRIPVGGGLGGGSADAGAVLRALNAIAPVPLSSAALLALAGPLGADVPFLTQEVTPLALAWGRGDRMLPLAPLPSRRCTLACFPVGVPTVDAYRWLTESPAAPSPATVFDGAALSTWEGVTPLAHNEFERVVLPRYPQLAATLEALRGAPTEGTFSLMSGSGSTLFTIGRDAARTPEGDRWLAERQSKGAGGVRWEETFTASSVEPVLALD